MAESPGAAPDPHEQIEKLRQELEAEKAGSAHWREVARRREDALAELKQRTSIRAVVSVERRTAKLRAAARRGAAAARGRLGAMSVTAAALPASLELPARRRRLDDVVASIDLVAGADRPAQGATSVEGRSMVVVSIGSELAPGLDELEASGVRVVRAVDDAEVATAVAASTEELVGLVAPTTEPLTSQVWPVLARTMSDDVAVATGVLVHPERSRARATPHDLLVRSAGYEVEVDPEGTPHLRARYAGGEPRLPATTGEDSGDGGTGGAGAAEVVAASSGLVLLDRWAVAAAGGYVATGSPEASVIDLCLRLRRGGGRVVCVPAAMALDHRPVASLGDLVRPLDETAPAWRGLLERHGPAIRRAAPGCDVGAIDLVLTVASPMRKVADRWGDWHLAHGLARAMRDRGHQVHVQTLDEVGSPRSRSADVHVVLRGLARVARTSGQSHVLWVISHPEDLDDEEIDAADLVLVASARFAEVLRERTATPVGVLLQATDADRFRPMAPDPAHRHDVTVVGKSRDVLRPMVGDALAAGLRPAVYGSGWEHLVDPSLIVADHVDNQDLPTVYSSAGVVLNDHWDTMRGWGFVSNRVFDVLACGTPLVSDPVPGLADAVEDLVATWTTPDELAAAVEAALAVDRADFAARARALVIARHTFAHRAAELEEALTGGGLVRRP